MNKTAEEHLEKFIEALTIDDALFSDIKKYLTLTQQNDCRYVNKISVEANLMGILGLFKRYGKVEVKEKIGTNKLMRDFIITLSNGRHSSIPKTTKLQCRLIKEDKIRETSIDGIWGVNISSFKHVK